MNKSSVIANLASACCFVCAFFSTAVYPARPSTSAVTTECPELGDDPSCFSNPLCGENAGDCATAIQSPAFYCCTGGTQYCCQYFCGPWECPYECHAKFGGFYTGWVLCLPNSGTEHLRLTTTADPDKDCNAQTGRCVDEIPPRQ